MFSAFNPSKCTHLEQWNCAAPGSSRGLPAGARIRTHNLGLPWVSSPMLYPLGPTTPQINTRYNQGMQNTISGERETLQPNRMTTNLCLFKVARLWQNCITLYMVRVVLHFSYVFCHWTNPLKDFHNYYGLWKVYILVLGGWHACKVNKHFQFLIICIFFFLLYFLNDSQTIRSTIHFPEPLLCLTLICCDRSDCK